jgi:hypothetical protein
MPTFVTLKIARLPQSLYILGHDHVPVPVNKQIHLILLATKRGKQAIHFAKLQGVAKFSFSHRVTPTNSIFLYERRKLLTF